MVELIVGKTYRFKTVGYGNVPGPVVGKILEVNEQGYKVKVYEPAVFARKIQMYNKDEIEEAEEVAARGGKRKYARKTHRKGRKSHRKGRKTHRKH